MEYFPWRLVISQNILIICLLSTKQWNMKPLDSRVLNQIVHCESEDSATNNIFSQRLHTSSPSFRDRKWFIDENVINSSRYIFSKNVCRIKNLNIYLKEFRAASINSYLGTDLISTSDKHKFKGILSWANVFAPSNGNKGKERMHGRLSSERSR